MYSTNIRYSGKTLKQQVITQHRTVQHTIGELNIYFGEYKHVKMEGKKMPSSTIMSKAKQDIARLWQMNENVYLTIFLKYLNFRKLADFIIFHHSIYSCNSLLLNYYLNL